MSEKLEIQPQRQDDSGLALIMNSDVNKMANQLQAISNFQAMVEKNLNSGQDFGVIPGTQKPTLLKPGAEKIQMLMGVSSEYEVIEKVEDYEKGFFAYTVRATLLKNGNKITEGLGSANTKEKRYRNQDVFMIVNTVLKMAKKRAQVDATLTIASLSNVFTQDIEDMDRFNQSEQIETMNDNDAATMKLTFGKHKGTTIGELVKKDRSYVVWLSDKGRDEATKEAAKMVLHGPSNSKTTKTDNITNDGSGKASKAKIELIVGYSKNIAKVNGSDDSLPANQVLAEIIDGWKGKNDDWNALNEEDATKACTKLQKQVESLKAPDKEDPFINNSTDVDIPDDLPF